MCITVTARQRYEELLEYASKRTEIFQLGAQGALKNDKVRGEKEQRAEEKRIFATDILTNNCFN